MKILGIDPGYGIVGWGVIEPVVGNLAPGGALYGVITTDAGMPSPERMEYIQDQVDSLLLSHNPDCVVVEKLFMNKNLKTAAEVYQARGVILASASRAGCEVLELTPNRIKHMIVGHGNATKVEVEVMVQRLLNIREKIRPDDAADALAGALCGAFTLQSRSILERAEPAAGLPGAGPALHSDTRRTQAPIRRVPR